MEHMPETEKKEDKAKDKRRDELKRTLKKAGKAYAALNSQLNTDQISSPGQKDEQRIAMLTTYKDEIDEFIGLCPDGDYGTFDTYVIKVLLQDYDFLFPGGQSTVTKDYDVMAGAQESIRKSDKKDDSEAPAMDANLSGAQLNGLNEIAKWMYRNDSKTGAISLAPTQEFFVRNLLKQPARVKLFMYYLIENKKRHNPKPEDVMESQMTYVPNLERFKNQMIATKFKFWKRVDGSYIYWEKLEQVYHTAQSCMGIFALYGNLGPADSVSRESEPTGVSQAGDAAEGGSAPAPLTEQEKKAREREQTLYDLIDLIGQHRTLVADREGGKDISLDFVEASALVINTVFQKLVQLDASMQDIKPGEEDFESTAGEKAEEYIGYGATAVGAGASVDKTESVLDGAKKVFGKKLIKWNLSDASLKGLNLSSGILTSVAGVTSFASVLAGIVNVYRNAESLSPGEVAVQVSGIVGSFAEIANTITTGAYAIKNAGFVGGAAEAGKAALAHADAAAAGASAVVGGITMIQGYAQTATADAGLQTGEEAMADLKKSGASNEAMEKMNEIHALESRINESRLSSGGMQAVAGGLQMIGGLLDASGAGAIAGTIFNTLGSAISLAKSIKEYFERKNNMISTIDTYIKMDVLWKAVSKGLVSKAHRQKNEVQSRETQIRTQLRAEALGLLGYSSPESFYRHITRTYAEFMYYEAFYKDAEHTKAITKEEAKSGDNPYAKMIKSFGLRLKYPEKEDGVPSPDIETIASKMSI